MYSKLFASILDSSVWLEPMPTRIVWLTLLAAKDQDGFARFASIDNLARRAVVEIEEASAAVAKLEAPDPNSSNPAHEGRRIERVPGGWMVLNAKLYDDMVRKEDERRGTRERVRKHRERHAPDRGESAPADRQMEAVTTGAAALIVQQIRDLAEDRSVPGQSGGKVIRKEKVQALGSDIFTAYEAIGGCERLLTATGQARTWINREFAEALNAARA